MFELLLASGAGAAVEQFEEFEQFEESVSAEIELFLAGGGAAGGGGSLADERRTGRNSTMFDKSRQPV